MDNWPIYVEDEGNPRSLVGIEQVFDVVLTYDDNYEIRYIGTLDGVVQKKSIAEYFVDENKTAVRLGDAWRNAFDVKHQQTGYCAISTAVFRFKIMRCRVIGLRLKPANKGEDVYPFETLPRTEDAIQHWATWVREMVRRISDTRMITSTRQGSRILVIASFVHARYLVFVQTRRTDGTGVP